MEYYLNKKCWRISKSECDSGGGRRSSSSSSSYLPRSISHRSSNHYSSSKSPFLRTFSMKSSSSSRTPPLSRNSSSSSRSPSLSRNSSQKCADFGRRCRSLAKEQRARFYIVKRCIKELVCWRKDRD